MASQSEVRAFEIEQEGQEDRTPLPAADLNPDLSQAIEDFNPASAFAPQSPPPPQIKDSDVSNIIESAMKAINRAASVGVATYQSSDMTRYLNSVDEIRAIYTGNKAELENIRRRAETSIDAKKEGLREEARGKAERSVADQARAQKIADDAAYLNHLFGVDGNAGRIAEKVKIWHTLNDRSIVLKEQTQKDLQALQEEEGVKFTDDPLRWLSGIFTIPQLSNQIEAKTKEVDIINNEIAGVFADIQGNVAAAREAHDQRSKALPTITAAQAAADQNVLAAQANINVSNANLDLAKQSTDFAQLKFAEAASMASAESQALNAQMEDQRLKFEAAARAISKADNDAKAKLMVAKLAMDLQDREQIEGILRIAEKRMGWPANTFNYTQFMRAPDEAKAYLTGMAMGWAGSSPAESFFRIKDMTQKGIGFGPGISVQMKSNLQHMQDHLTFLQNSPEFKALSGKEQQHAYVVKKMNERFDQMQQNPTANPAENPFYEASPQQVSIHSPEFAKSKVGKLLEPLIKSQVQPDTSIVVETLLKGAASPQEAVQMITGYYKLNLKVRNFMNDYQSLGYQLRNDSYYWQYRTPGNVFSQTEWINLTKPEDVMRMILKKKAVELTSPFGSEFSAP